MSDKQYDPKKVEDKIYRLWEKSGYFNPDKTPTKTDKNTDQYGKSRHKSVSSPRKSAFTIIMPPPNANGLLHMGHALFVALEDLMTRYKRMRGYKTLWLPGADHAGIETEFVYRKKLEKEGKRWKDFPRDQLYNDIYTFTQANKGAMENQLRKLGASCDWSREKFTLDPAIVAKTQEAFIHMYNDGLIYRGTRIINWSVKDQTALSDLEITHEERLDPLYYIKYGPLTLATVRPETKFGDTAVAVHPKDKRYQKYIGKEIEIETIIGPAKLRVIADETVDPKFGTGVVKVTPAHDPVDFEIGERHNLEIRQVIGFDGKLNDKTGPFAGLKVDEARKKIADAMKEKGILVKVDEDYKHSVAISKRSGGIIEPMILPQWFLAMTKSPKSGKKSLRDLAVESVKNGKIKIIPKRFEKIFFQWMKNLRDWNISRQVVWGIRIPAWYCMSCGDVKMNPKIKARWYLIRHGETDWNKEHRYQGHSDVSLNEAGRQQINEVIKQLKNKNIDLVISSDLSRSKETADLISKELGAELLIDKRFRERSGGEWEGMRIHEIGEKHGFDTSTLPLPKEFNEFKPVGGETWAEVEKRVLEALHHHRKENHHRNVVIITHFVPMAIIHNSLKKIPQEQTHQYAPRNAEIIELSLSSEKCLKCDSDLIEQDPDVFDTWFSSGQWPFLTLDFPESKDYKTFYPTDVMETGWDIFFIWVTRMIMLGIYRTGKIPFRIVYLHGLVRDKDRVKMSKSKGNVIDPLGVAEIYGADAVRMALITSAASGNDPVISEDKIRGYRNFATKIWNVARFILMNYDPKLQKVKPKFTAADRKNLKEVKTIREKVAKKIEDFKFHEAASLAYQYFWHKFADKIIESSKPRLNSENPVDKAAAFETNLKILSESLKMLHPFMPFITEEIWQNIKKFRRKDGSKSGASELLMIENW